MPGKKGKSGGKRNNSGRRAKNQTWGSLNATGGLHNFNFTSSQTSVAATSTPSTASPAPAPARETTTLEPTLLASTLPNNDSDELFDEELCKRGKNLSQSQNLLLQRTAISKKTYREKASKMVKDHGVLWDRPPDIMKHPKHSLKERWLDFFKLRVFNWMPEALTDGDLNCVCPNANCKKKLAKNGNGVLPRLVFDTHENYWLNSPSKYICTACEDKCKANPELKIQYSWNSSSESILNQLEPELTDLFPCYLSARNAIDIKLMDTVINNAVKGIGPSAMVENLVTWHELQWQKTENQWAGHVVEKLQNPSISQLGTPTRRSEIEKCPAYFSSKLGGCVPSGKWLIEMFCVVIQRNRHYYDSECIKRAKSSKLLAIDASYKVPKWMMKWDKNFRIYDALHSGTNEYNEVVMQRFSTSDNHNELGSNLNYLSNLGLNPYLCFSDDPNRDESLLKEVFSNLSGDNDADDNGGDERNEMNEMTTEKEIFYLTKIDHVLTMLSSFITDVSHAISDTSIGGKVKVAFDAGKLFFFIIMSYLY